MRHFLRTVSRGVRFGFHWFVGRILTINLWLARSADFENGYLAKMYDADCRQLREQLAKTKADHRREVDCLTDELAIARRHNGLLVDVITRERERVAAEIAIATRRQQDALAGIGRQGGESGGFVEELG